MTFAPVSIGVIAGADAAMLQRCLGAFAARRAQAGRIVGVVEIFDDEPDGGAAPGAKARCLRSLADGREFTLFQDLGREAASCSLLPEGLIAAGEAVRRQIADGCDLVVLSKFGKLEAEIGSGLVPAFAEALTAGVPILTSVSSRFAEQWDRFAAPLYVTLPARDDAMEQWWDALNAR